MVNSGSMELHGVMGLACTRRNARGVQLCLRSVAAITRSILSLTAVDRKVWPHGNRPETVTSYITPSIFVPREGFSFQETHERDALHRSCFSRKYHTRFRPLWGENKIVAYQTFFVIHSSKNKCSCDSRALSMSCFKS